MSDRERRRLALEGKGLTSVPESVGGYISHNRLTSVPDSIGRLSALKEICTVYF